MIDRPNGDDDADAKHDERAEQDDDDDHDDDDDNIMSGVYKKNPTDIHTCSHKHTRTQRSPSKKHTRCAELSCEL